MNKWGLGHQTSIDSEHLSQQYLFRNSRAWYTYFLAVNCESDIIANTAEFILFRHALRERIRLVNYQLHMPQAHQPLRYEGEHYYVL